MNWQDYKILSEKTLSSEFHCDKQTEYLLHAIMGVMTELEELLGWRNDSVGKGEEVGDVFWYLAILGREFDANANFELEIKKQNILTKWISRLFLKRNNEKIVLSMYKKSSLILDMLKKKIFYNREFSREKFKDLYLSLMSDSVDYCSMNSLDLNSILQININKLKARYGSKFSSESANNRDLDTERKILENK